MGRRQSLDTSPDGRVPCLLSRGPWLNVCVRAGRRKVELGLCSWGQEELTSSGEVREGILASWEPDLGDACIRLGCQEAKPPERPRKASPPRGRGAGSQLARKPRATPHRAGLSSTPEAELGWNEISVQLAFSVPTVRSVRVSRASWMLSRLPIHSRPWQGLGKCVLPPPGIPGLPPDPTTCLRALKQLARFPRALEKGGDPGIHSRVRAGVPTKPGQRALCASCKVSARG